MSLDIGESLLLGLSYPALPWYRLWLIELAGFLYLWWAGLTALMGC